MSVIAIDQGTTGTGVHVLESDGRFRSGATIDHRQFTSARNLRKARTRS